MEPSLQALSFRRLDPSLRSSTRAAAAPEALVVPFIPQASKRLALRLRLRRWLSLVAFVPQASKWLALRLRLRRLSSLVAFIPQASKRLALRLRRRRWLSLVPRSSGEVRSGVSRLASAASWPPWPERPPEGAMGPPWPERLPEGVMGPPWPERLPEGVMRTATPVASAASYGPERPGAKRQERKIGLGRRRDNERQLSRGPGAQALAARS